MFRSIFSKTILRLFIFIFIPFLGITLILTSFLNKETKKRITLSNIRIAEQIEFNINSNINIAESTIRNILSNENISYLLSYGYTPKIDFNLYTNNISNFVKGIKGLDYRFSLKIYSLN